MKSVSKIGTTLFHSLGPHERKVTQNCYHPTIINARKVYRKMALPVVELTVRVANNPENAD